MKTKIKIFIRTNGNSQMGMGHTTRCLALAEMLQDKYTIVFIISEIDLNIVNIISPYVDEVITINNVNVAEEWKRLQQHITSNDILVIDDYNLTLPNTSNA